MTAKRCSITAAKHGKRCGKQSRTLALIFCTAQNRFQDPAKLRRVIIALIDAKRLVRARRA
jgi:hypothetical protein